MQSRRSVAAISLLLALCLSDNSLAAEPIPYPQCAIEASTTPLDSVIHLYGDGLGEFSVPDSFPVFSKVFDLYVTDSVSTRWDAAEISYFIDSIMDNDSTDLSDDLFPIVWDYFCFKDSNEAYAGVDITVGVNRYTKLKIILYDHKDIDCECTASGDVCCGYSTARGWGVALSTRERGGNPIDIDTVLGQGFAHELEHVCWMANGFGSSGAVGYENLFETVATLAEYRAGSFRAKSWDWPYDESILRGEECATNNYVSEKLWMSYLYETFKGGPGDTDDLIYEWIRETPVDLTLSGLADMLWEGGYAWAGGVNADERFNNVFQYFAVAKFANAPDLVSNSRFGSTEFNSMDTFGFFANNCDWFADSIPTPNEPVDCPPNNDHEGCWNVRILPPAYTLGSSDENTMTVVDGIYTDADGSMDYIDVAVYGTDYIVFSADSYFQDGNDHELYLSLRGGYDNHTDKEPFVWVLGYDTTATDLPRLPGNLRFAEPATVRQETSSPDTFEVSVVIPGFGKAIQSVILTVTSIYEEPKPYNGVTAKDSEHFGYEYSYGVMTPGSQAVTWSGNVFLTGDVTVAEGDSLIIDEGTTVRVWPTDLSEDGADTTRIELNVSGYLEINGTATSPVAIQSWTPATSSDWVGIYVDTLSEGAAIRHCTVSDAEYAIDAYAPLVIDSSTISNTAQAGIVVTNAELTLSASTVGNSDGSCILLNGSDATINSSTVEGYYEYGLRLSGTGVLDLTDTSFLGDSVGVYVEDNSETSGTILRCLFEDNSTALSYYRSSRPWVDNCTIQNNDLGIHCDTYSHVTIRHCITSQSYSGNITSNGGGLLCTNYASPQVGETEISNSGTGLYCDTGSNPDFQTLGNNAFVSNTNYHMANLAQGLTIAAQGNYWYPNKGAPLYLPKPGKFMGSVDYTQALSSAPNPSSAYRGEETSAAVPKTYELTNLYPNPFNPTIQVRFGVPERASVEIDIFDVRGRRIRTLVHGEFGPGYHVRSWNGIDNNGAPAASAVYFLRMRAGHFVDTRKIVLIR